MLNLFFWRGIEEASFKPTEGGFLFYPYGALGGGYVVTPDQKADLAAFLRRFYLFGTIVILLLIGSMAFSEYLMMQFGLTTSTFGFMMMELAVVVPVTAAQVLYFHRGMRACLGSAPRVSERLSLGEAQRMATRTMSSLRVAVILVLAGGMAAGSLIMLYFGISAGDRETTIIGAFSAAFFGACFLMSCHQARLKMSRVG